jgi:hypothetical protein
MHVTRFVVAAVAATWMTVGCDGGLPSLEEMFQDAGSGSGDAREAADAPIPELECGTAEQAFAGPVCVSRERSSAVIRFVTPSGTRGSVVCNGPAGVVRHDEEESSVLHRVSLADLSPRAEYECAYGVVEGEGAGEVLWRVELSPVAEVTGPVITEVLANPLGPEPAQEFVEVLNPGASPVDLGLLRLMDVDPAGLEDPSEHGDPLPPGTHLAPGAVALLVPESFATTGSDPTPAPDATIVRLDGSLARSGLRNSGGEPVFLVDAEHTVISSYLNLLGSLEEGMSAQRVDPRAPGSDPDNWIGGPPTPGAL